MLTLLVILIIAGVLISLAGSVAMLLLDPIIAIAIIYLIYRLCKGKDKNKTTKIKKK